jgi:ribose transport system ATP-binding protein
MPTSGANPDDVLAVLAGAGSDDSADHDGGTA